MNTQQHPEPGLPEHRDHTARSRALLAAAVLSALTAGCSSAAAGTGSTTATKAPTSLATTTAPASTTSASSGMPGMSLTDTGPSASALMVCGPEIQKAVTTALALTATPTTTTTWADHLYTCTYHLPSGRLVLSVKESPDSTSANAYFTDLRQQLGDTRALTGAEGLGNPGYESSSGTVVILKDGKTLKVDATGMPTTSGPAKTSRIDLAYEITTDILGCWSEK